MEAIDLTESINSINSMSIGKVLECAASSDELFAAIVTLDKRLEKISVYISPQTSKIFVEMPTKQHFTWYFSYPEAASPDSLIPKCAFTIGSNTFECIKTDTAFYSGSGNLSQSIPIVAEHFLHLFNCSDCSLNELIVDLAAIDDVRKVCVPLKSLKKIQHVAILNNTARAGTVVPKISTTASIEWILTHLRMAAIRIGCDIQRTEQNGSEVNRIRDMFLTRPHIYLDNANWMTPQEITRFYAKTVMIGKPNSFTATDLSEFIQSWINGEHSNLWWLNVKMNQHHSLNAILRTIPNHRPILPIKYCCCPLRLINGRPKPFYFLTDTVQVRRSDGTTALLCVSQSQFFFHVKNDGPPEPLEPEPRATLRHYEVLDLLSQMQVETYRARIAVPDDIKQTLNNPNRLRIEPEVLREMLQNFRRNDPTNNFSNYSEFVRQRQQMEAVQRRLVVLEAERAAHLESVTRLRQQNAPSQQILETEARANQALIQIQRLQAEEREYMRVLAERQRAEDAARGERSPAYRRIEEMMEARRAVLQARPPPRAAAPPAAAEPPAPPGLDVGRPAEMAAINRDNNLVGMLLREQERLGNLHAGDNNVHVQDHFLHLVNEMRNIDVLLRRRGGDVVPPPQRQQPLAALAIADQDLPVRFYDRAGDRFIEVPEPPNDDVVRGPSDDEDLEVGEDDDDDNVEAMDESDLEADANLIDMVDSDGEDDVDDAPAA